MNLDSDRLVDAYLDDVAKEAATLPAGRRDELLADLRAHIAEARMSGSDTGEVLQRLGRPSEIVAAATEGLVLVEIPPRMRPRDFAAVALLLIGPFVFGVGWVIGVWLLWTSNRWTRVWKLVGTMAWPLAYAAALVAEFVQPPFWGSIAIAAVVNLGLLGALVKNARA
ncbi:hypothetical protein AB0E69_37430 [Kribbella sp. NPDC026611]|uniref:HAAS signaling domain-containing protein n=1 Tax=Kribbella sp. NPDC026611 TaxID=3154911 RepID=UPI0033FD18E5